MDKKMETVLYSHEGKYRAIVRAIPNREDDGFHFKVDVTKKEFDSQRKAIRNARSWLKKKRRKYYKKHPRKWVKRTRGIPKEERMVKFNPIKTLHKLHKMEKDAAKILIKHSGKKLKLHKEYSKKTWNKRKVCAVSGDHKDFALAISSVMKKGTIIERKAVSKMLKKFVSEPYQKSNLFY